MCPAVKDCIEVNISFVSLVRQLQEAVAQQSENVLANISFLFVPRLLITVHNCVYVGATITNLTGHRIFCIPNRERKKGKCVNTFFSCRVAACTDEEVRVGVTPVPIREIIFPICVCTVHNPLLILLKTGVSFRFSLIERQQAHNGS